MLPFSTSASQKKVGFNTSVSVSTDFQYELVVPVGKVIEFCFDAWIIQDLYKFMKVSVLVLTGGL